MTVETRFPSVYDYELCTIITLKIILLDELCRLNIHRFFNPLGPFIRISDYSHLNPPNLLLWNEILSTIVILFEFCK